MPEMGASEILPKPASGRVFERGRRVRLADVDPSGRCRLDAMVRYLQDIARDDSADSGLTDPMTWVVRRTMVDVHRAPVFQEDLRLATWCSGHGARWAERRTEIVGDDGAHAESVTLWIYVDGETGAPRKLNDDFFDIYGATASDRRVNARQQLPTAPPDDASSMPWPVRFADLDVLAHVNNAAQWAPVEEACSLAGMAMAPIRAELEHGAGVEPGEAELRWAASDGGVSTWLLTAAGTGSAGRVRPL